MGRRAAAIYSMVQTCRLNEIRDNRTGWALHGHEDICKGGAMSLHVATDHCGVEDVHRGEQRRCAVPLIVVRHGSGAVLFPGSPG